MTVSNIPNLGRIIRISTPAGPQVGVVVAGPYASGAPGEEWMVVPLLAPDDRPRNDELLVADGSYRAAAWAAQPIARKVLGSAIGELPTSEVERVWSLVVAIDEGRVVSQPVRGRDEVLRLWYAASVSPLLPEVGVALELEEFFARQVVLFMQSDHPGLIPTADLARLRYDPLPRSGSLRARICTAESSAPPITQGAFGTTRRVRLCAHHGLARAV